jgi:hypothetical protein
MHEIAKIIGADKAEKELFGVLEAFLKDPSKYEREVPKSIYSIKIFPL